MKKLILIILAVLMLSGCATKLDSEMAEEVTIGHAKCKEAGFETEIKIDIQVITIKCNPYE